MSYNLLKKYIFSLSQRNSFDEGASLRLTEIGLLANRAQSHNS